MPREILPKILSKLFPRFNNRFFLQKKKKLSNKYPLKHNKTFSKDLPKKFPLKNLAKGILFKCSGRF